jgi:hypothetical protein
MRKEWIMFLRILTVFTAILLPALAMCLPAHAQIGNWGYWGTPFNREGGYWQSRPYWNGDRYPHQYYAPNNGNNQLTISSGSAGGPSGNSGGSTIGNPGNVR